MLLVYLLKLCLTCHRVLLRRTGVPLAVSHVTHVLPHLRHGCVCTTTPISSNTPKQPLAQIPSETESSSESGSEVGSAGEGVGAASTDLRDEKGNLPAIDESNDQVPAPVLQATS